MRKRSILIIISIIVIGLVILGLYSTFASSSTITSSDNVYNITLIENGGEVSVPAGESKTVMYQITNTNKGTVQYGVAYSGTNIEVKVYEDSSDKVTGNIDYGESKFIKLIITNKGTTASTASISGVLGYEKGGELDSVVPSGKTLVTKVYTKPVNLVDFLTNKYLNASPAKATTANNGIYYYYAPSVGMMNDGMGTNHTWEDGANTGNIRYYGATPSNYIDIGDRNSSGNVIPWRIIGVFKNMTLADGSTDTLVKVIRVQSTMQWDDDSNDWHNATLQTYLNTGEFYTGLPQSVKDKIAKVEWNLGGWNTSSGVYSNVIYEKERLSGKCSSCTYDTIWEGDIALMYPSDYGYASDLTKCSKDLYNYNTDTINCTGTDWLSIYKNQWLLTPDSSTASSTLNAMAGGGGGGVGWWFDVRNEAVASPALYLKSDLVKESGDGSSVSSAYVVR